MSDLEAVLADVSYLMAMEKSKNVATKAPKKNIIPDSSIRSVMVSYLRRHGKINFEDIFHDRLGFIFFVKFCKAQESPDVHLIEFYEAIKDFELIDSECDRVKEAKRVYDTYIMKELLSKAHPFSSEHVKSVQNKLTEGMKCNSVSRKLFSVYVDDLKRNIKNVFYESFLKSKQFTLYLQWMDVQLNTTLTMSDFSVHRIIGRGGFGEVYGCRKLDSGKM
ncbi:unnamed protein product [Hydatigera taeniaeformis]|uniref:RGS domain-containing protein n=1 Tax=Hydatigena taeniaeformis TaxID=6205 RepID=A0A158REB1_HYDTA|nr:unnamed protein product [Hydatigera taeniaeformis]